MRAAQDGAAPATPADAASGPAPQAPGSVRQSLRVPVEKLDGLTHLAAELVIQSLKASQRHVELRRLDTALGRLRDRAREARLAPAAAAGAGPAFGEYAEALEQLSRRLRQFCGEFSDDRVRLNLITEEFRQNVISLTMLPLHTVFDAFPRAARDLARQFDKEVEVTISGRETELDKKIIEQISDPLIHLVRNAIDHGIERPAERLRKVKPAAGQLLISAEQQGNRILISVRDDGRGIDPEELRAAAIRRALAPAADMERWSTAELLELVFQPGFSTRASTTDVSGRGVGMDVVKNVVVRLGGSVRIQSEPEHGTTVVLDLPLSLALLRVVLVETGDELFALPTASVRRLLHVKPEDILAVPGRTRDRSGRRDDSADVAERAAQRIGRARRGTSAGARRACRRGVLRSARRRGARGAGARLRGAAPPAARAPHVCRRRHPGQRRHRAHPRRPRALRAGLAEAVDPARSPAGASRRPRASDACSSSRTRSWRASSRRAS